MGQTEAQERIGEQAFVLDGLMTRFTDAIAAVGHAREGRIDLRQQPHHFGLTARRMPQRLQPLLAFQQLRAQLGLRQRLGQQE